MSDEPTLSTAAFGRAFRAFLEQSVSEKVTVEPPFVARLAEHLGANPRELPIVAQHLSAIEHPNAQVALDVWARGEGRSAELLGMSAEQKRYGGLGMADLISPVRGGLTGDMAPQPGPVDYENVAVARDRTMTCVQHSHAKDLRPSEYQSSTRPKSTTRSPQVLHPRTMWSESSSSEMRCT